MEGRNRERVGTHLYTVMAVYVCVCVCVVCVTERWWAIQVAQRILAGPDRSRGVPGEGDWGPFAKYRGCTPDRGGACAVASHPFRVLL